MYVFNEWIFCTDKRTNVWSRDFMIWKVNFGQWAVAWAGMWNKSVLANYEQLLRPVFSLFQGQNFKFFFDPEKGKKWTSKVAHNRPGPFFPQTSPSHSPQPQIDFPYHEISGPDICSLICEAEFFSVLSFPWVWLHFAFCFGYKGFRIQDRRNRGVGTGGRF